MKENEKFQTFEIDLEKYSKYEDELDETPTIKIDPVNVKKVNVAEIKPTSEQQYRTYNASSHNQAEYHTSSRSRGRNINWKKIAIIAVLAIAVIGLVFGLVKSKTGSVKPMDVDTTSVSTEETTSELAIEDSTEVVGTLTNGTDTTVSSTTAANGSVTSATNTENATTRRTTTRTTRRATTRRSSGTTAQATTSAATTAPTTQATTQPTTAAATSQLNDY